MIIIDPLPPLYPLNIIVGIAIERMIKAGKDKNNNCTKDKK